MSETEKKNHVYSHTDSSKVVMSEEEWQKILPKDVYHIARQKGTERPWSSSFEKSNEVGTYYCAVCGNPLFKSDTKFESGCGWPSFYEPISKSSIIYTPVTAASGKTALATLTFLMRSAFPTIDSAAYERDCVKNVQGSSTLSTKMA